MITWVEARVEPRSDKLKTERLESESSILDLDVKALKAETEARRARPFDQFEYVDVTFNAVANTDTDIIHTLEPPTPDDLDFQVVQWRFASAPAAAPVVYIDTSASRKQWSTGYLVLRCNVAAANATLLLTVRRQ